MEEWQKAWAAGIIDFQGRIYTKSNAQRASGSQQITLTVDTSVPGIARRLCAMTGVSPEPKKHHALKREWLRRGCDEHCPEAHQHVRPVNMPDTTRWTVTGTALAIVLWNLRNYMTTDHQPWEWAMDSCLAQLRLKGQGSAMVIVTAQRLWRLGWELPPSIAHLAPKELTA